MIASTNLRLLAAGFAAGAFPVAAEAAAGPGPGPAKPPMLSPSQLDRTWTSIEALFHAEGGGNAIGHLAVAAVLFAMAVLLRRLITQVIFAWLRRLAAKTTTTLDDRLFGALDAPVAWLVFVLLSFAALRVLVLPPWVDTGIGYAFDLAWVVILFWGLLRALNAIVDHLAETGSGRGLALSHFMPLLKKTLGLVFIALAALTVAQRMGINVGAFVAGLGIGGLAFALAAQDTIANFFGSVVVAADRPFRVGDYVSIGAVEGTVEDVGLRSTKLRTGARTQVYVPNKTVANEVVTNFTRMPQRRVDQKIGLTYATTPDQMQAILGDIRTILRGDPGVHPQTIAVYFSGYGESSLDIQLMYFSADPDWARHMELRERVNLAIMRAVAARGLSFAFPTQTLHVDDDVARKLAGAKPAAPR